MSQESTTSSKETILVVDDTPANLRLLSKMLSNQGYKVRVALSGKLALESVELTPPDLILLDIMMPVMDGYEVCQQLKADERTRDIPVIFISALKEAIDKVKAFSSGGVDYITKPFQMEEVLARVENQLSIGRLSKQLAQENARLQKEIREKEAAARQRQQVEEALQQSAIKLRHQNLVLTELARNQALNQGDLKAALKEITEATAKELAVERASVWLFDETGTYLQCLDLFEKSLNLHSEGVELALGNYPAYFQALSQESVIVADDAHTDPRTREFSSVYLTRLGITSMLDAPIRLGDVTVGVLCCEHVGAASDWMPEDQNFARSAADLVSLALQARERKRAETALRESEKKFALAFRSSPDAITITTLTDGRYIEVNDSFCQLFGYDAREVIGHTLTELNIWVNREDQVRLRQLLHEEGVVRNLEVAFRTRSGAVRTGLLSAEIIDLGFELCVLSISKDITDRKRTEEALRQSEKRYRELFEGSVDGIVMVDLKGRFIDCNASYQKMLGYSLAELKQKRFLEITPQKWHQGEAEIIKKQVIARGYSDTYKKEYIRKDGTVFPVELTVYCQRNDSGAPEMIWAIVRDISDAYRQAAQRKLAEAALSESEKKYRNLVEASQDMIWSVDAFGRYTFVNSAVKQIYGYEPEEMLGHPFSEFEPPEQIAKDLEVFQRLLQGESVFQYETTHLAKDGRPIQLMFNAIAVQDKQGNFVGTTGTASDITERKRIEQERSELIASLQKSEATLAEAQRVAHVGSWEFDVVTETFTWSEEIFRIFGLDPTEPEPTYSQLIEMIHPNDRALFQQTIEQAIAQKTSYEFNFRILQPDSAAYTLPFGFSEGVQDTAQRATLGASGSIRHIEARGETVVNDTLQVIRLFGTALDITDHKQAEEALRESVLREHAIAKVIQRIRQTLDLDTIFSATTEELRQLLKCDRVAIYRFNPDWSGEFVAESVANGWISLFADQKNDPHLKEGFLDNENCAVKTLHLENDPVQDTYLQETQGGAKSQGASYLCVEDIYKAGFNSCYINVLERFQARAYITVPIFCGSKLWGLLASYQNSGSRQWEAAEINIVVQIGTQLGVALQQAQLLEETQRQAAQLKEAKEAAEVANRAKSQFLANMSHELRTPLNAILGFTQVMNRDGSLSDEQRQQLDIIMRSGEHLLELINDILEMSKIEAGRTTFNESSFDLFHLLDNLQEMLQIKAQVKGLQLIFERTPDVPQYVLTDEGKLRQVLINLLGNAIKFTQKGRVTLRVRVGMGTVQSQNSKLKTQNALTQSKIQNPPALASPLAAKSQIEFEVEDTGPGIAPEEIGSLFEPFTQTATGRKSSEGTGLGLPISRSFVQLMGGDITVNSNLGKGTTFTFDILLKLAQASDIQTAQATGRVIGLAPDQRAYRILVVEDKWTNRLLLVKILKAVGFQVREAENGQEAVALWSSWKPHLIFMDMQMPVMDGYEATKLIRKAEGMRKAGGKRILALHQQLPQGSKRDKVQDETSSGVKFQLHNREHQTDNPLHPTLGERLSFTRNSYEDNLHKRRTHLTLHTSTVIIALTASAFAQQRTAILSVGCDDFIHKPFRENVLFEKMACHLGVRYLYEAEAQSSITGRTTPPSALTSEALNVMPTEWVQELYQAAISMDDRQIVELIEQIPQTQATLASTLMDLVDNFRLDIIIDCLEGEQTSTNED